MYAVDREMLTAKGFFVHFVDLSKGLPNCSVNRMQLDAQFAF